MTTETVAPAEVEAPVEETAAAKAEPKPSPATSWRCTGPPPAVAVTSPCSTWA